jgi:micrococcal nuclease
VRICIGPGNPQPFAASFAAAVNFGATPSIRQRILLRRYNYRHTRRLLVGVVVLILLLTSARFKGWWPFERTLSARAGAARDTVLRAAIPPGHYTLTGRVVYVADGDTVTLKSALSTHRIRLDSIDAPEKGRPPAQPGQPYAEAARQYLAKLAKDQTLEAICYEKDQYGRELCALILSDGRSLNRLQVQAGYAWAYTANRGYYLRDPAMPALERQARQASRGLWAQVDAVPPWKWRYDCWKQHRC